VSRVFGERAGRSESNSRVTVVSPPHPTPPTFAVATADAEVWRTELPSGRAASTSGSNGIVAGFWAYNKSVSPAQFQISYSATLRR
jgi:hypothetical protein